MTQSPLNTEATQPSLRVATAVSVGSTSRPDPDKPGTCSASRSVPVGRRLNHTYACALPGRGGSCDCGASPL